jgi:hypothetical protein
VTSHAAVSVGRSSPSRGPLPSTTRP